jgi:RNA polymerase sigma factor (sigma-70 family)
VTNDDDIDFGDIVRRCLAGDQKAWKVLTLRLTPLIIGICRTMRLSRDETYDVHGQVSYLLVRNLRNLRSPKKLLSYVGRITRNEALKIIRKLKLQETSESTLIENLPGARNLPPDESYDSVRRTEAVAAAMAMLPERCFELIWALFFDADEPSYKEILKHLGIPVQSIGPTRKRCLEKMKKIMKRHKLIFRY